MEPSKQNKQSKNGKLTNFTAKINATSLIKNYVEVDSFPRHKTMRDSTKINFLIDDLDEKNIDWNPYEADKSEWSRYNFETYLRYCPKDPPSLLEILECQQNAYYGNPSYLCRFEYMTKKMTENVNDFVEIWIQSTLLFHTLKYRMQYLDHMKLNPEVRFMKEKIED
tara:strand:+ start:116 stop:616 length:501 start_codon:yes stop_codon:yes gene_type:complete